MMTTLMGIGFALMPLAVIAAMLAVSEWRDRRRAERYARQIELTDAIHRELGAAAAPVVEDGPGGRLLVNLTVPLDQPALVTALLSITERVLGPRPAREARAFRVVLTPAVPRATSLAPARRPRPLLPRSPIPAIR